MNITELAKQASLNRERCYDMGEFLVLYTKLVLEEAAKTCYDYADKCVEAENWEAEDVAIHCGDTIRNLIK